ncbi:MAG TPA: TonB-dependent receptor [Gemmatimonadaceae bacterium]|nr:TonB-dependent receptor [Gemmatimonadaceae bacterium]
MRFRPLLCVVVLARLSAAQTPDATREAPRTTVSGAVRDSIAGTPLAAAIVQLVAVDSAARFAGTALSDSLGRFAIPDVPPGRYMLGFFHPMLDSLGVEPPVRGVTVDGHRPVRIGLSIPSPTRLREAICGRRSAADSGALVIGIVRDARDHVAAAGVAVTAVWLELSLRQAGVDRQVPRLAVTTAGNGWFALCDVPSAGTIALIASRGADSTDLIEVDIPARRFARRDLYIGPAVETGRLSGVVTAVGGTPLAEAQVAISDGRETRANERGEWTLADVPLGTRMLEVRAVGYYPERRVVDVVVGAPPIRTALSTMKAVLDTVRVTASRATDRNMSAFDERRRAGLGRFLTREDVARQRPLVTSDLFRMVPGLTVERSPLGETRLGMRGMFAESCSPGVYIDGHYMRDLSADDIDTWVKPNEIAGIELYTGSGAPPQFSAGMGVVGLSEQVCGSVVIWTRLPPAEGRRTSWKGGALRVLGLAAFALAVNALVR